jgi:hypothetical protein
MAPHTFLEYGTRFRNDTKIRELLERGFVHPLGLELGV